MSFPTETLATLRARVLLRLQDPNLLIWTKAQLNQYINLGCADLQQRTQWMEDWSGTQVTGGTGTYNRNSDIIQNMRYQVFDTTRIDAIDIYMLDRFKPDWRNDSPSIPIRVYRSDWNVDSLWPVPNTTGDTFTDSREFGIVVAIQDSNNNYVTTDNQQFGETQIMYDTLLPDDFFFTKNAYSDSNSMFGIDVQCISPHGNLMNVFSRYPDTLVNDTDVVPFPLFAHYAVEEFALFMAYSKEGDSSNPKLAKNHKDMYEMLWVPFLMRVVNNRTPDSPLIWKLQDPSDPHPVNYSTVTPSFSGIQGR